MSPKNDIQLLRINYLRGPNLWTYRAVLEVWLDLGELEAFPSNTLPGFTDRLIGFLPALGEHHCGVGEKGGFMQRLLEGTWAGHVMEHVVIELLNLAGMPTGFGQTRSTSRHGVYRMVFRARDEQVARAALAEGHALTMAAINDLPFDVTAAVGRVREQIDDCYLGPSTAAIVAAATDRGIPHIRLNDGNLVQLGHGGRQRRIWTAETDLTSAIAEGIARDKDLTKSLLKACGVPVPEGVIAASPAEAWEAAQDIGLPVVVKPTDGNHGRGVSLDLANEADVAAAWALADQHGSEVLVERSISGNEHRILVVGGKVVAAARGETAWVTGDGIHTVIELIDLQINSDPRRGITEDFPLNRIDVTEDDVVLRDLERQGLGPHAVPKADQRVLIQRNGNVSIDCTDDVHPEVAHAVSLAARVVGLDIAGIDVVAEDISRPLQEQGGAVVEVNAGPGLLMHIKPAEGLPRPVGRAIVDHLFEEGNDGRIAVLGVTGSQHTTAIARVLSWLLHLGGRHVGLACADGLFMGNRLVESKPSANWPQGQRLLMNRFVDTVVLESSPRAILEDGLSYDRCQVGIVTDLQGLAGLQDHDILDADQLFKVQRTQVDVVLPDGVAVLNADDAGVADMARLCDGEVLLFAVHADLPAVQAHVADGGRAVVARGSQVVLLQGHQATPCVQLDHPAVAALTEQMGLPGLLAVVGGAWAQDISPELMMAGLETCQGHSGLSPRRPA